MLTKVLIIEDNPDHILIAKKALEGAGSNYDIDSTEDSTEGLNRILHNDYNLVLCDYRMPGLSALDVLQKARQENKNMPFIVITSMGNEKIAVEAMKQGASDYIVKDSAYKETLPLIIQKAMEKYVFEKERQAMQKELFESAQKYRNIFDNANDAIFISDMRTDIILDANKQGELLIGRPKQEIVNMSWFDLFPVERLDYYRDNFKTQIQQDSAVDSSAEVVRRTGERIPVYISASVMEIGGRKAVQSIIKNMSDYKKLEEELIQSNKMAAMGQLAAGISHELNQPLTGIKGFAQAILMDLDEDNPLREDLNKIVEQAERMAKIIKNVRFFVQKAKFEFETLDINQPIKDSFVLLDEQLKLYNIKVVKELPDGLPKIRGDANQLQQVFLNLTTNACDAIVALDNKKNARMITVKTLLDENEGNLKIIFSDTGSGIEKEQLEQIFNPFYTTKSPGSGMGLGLSICYRIIQDHNGFMQVESIPGKGTTFILKFPIIKLKVWKTKQP